MGQPLLPEYVGLESEEDGTDDQQIALKNRVYVLEQEVANLKTQQKRAHRDAMQAIGRLLSPFYKALQPIFGEIAEVEGEAAASSGKQAQWESVKQRLQPRHREVIDILLLQGEMGRKQIASAIKMDYTNCRKNVIAPLISQGWLVESGGKIALKNL